MTCCNAAPCASTQGTARCAVIIVKKYANRRLYDTDISRYVTLDELAARIRDGADVRVVDAKTGTDLTQGVLTQIILESRGAGKLLPSSFLFQLIRMDDEDIALFMGRYLTWALEIYLQAKQASAHLGPFGALAQAPFQATSALARLFGEARPWGIPEPPGIQPTPYVAPDSTRDELDALRAEMDELKRSLSKGEPDS